MPRLNCAPSWRPAGRIAQTEGELAHARSEREEAAKARIDLAKALLRLEAMPRLEADLKALSDQLKTERQERTALSAWSICAERDLSAALPAPQPHRSAHEVIFAEIDRIVEKIWKSKTLVSH